MTKYLDEYNPNARSVNFRVQTDMQKLKFNNIQSCIAVVLVPDGGQQLVGVHLTTMTTASPNELKTAIQELEAAAGNSSCDAYLIATFGHHAKSGLKTELERIARRVFLCDVTSVSAKDTSADVDVKVELLAGQAKAYIRRHAVTLKDASGRAITKPNWNARTALPGRPANLTDRDAKPWMPVAFRQV